MKKIFSIVFFFSFVFTSAANEIKFLDNPEWDKVLEKAKKEKKMIFVDGYATWCNPCKKMDSDVYVETAVAAYYNANFINVRYNLETGEGKDLSDEYGATAYPYLMFIDADGKILHKGIGYKEPAEFLGLGKEAKDPNKQYYTLKNKAERLDPLAFENFIARAIEFEDEDAVEIINRYLEKQPDIVGTEELIRLLMVYVDELPNEKMLKHFKANKAKIIKSGAYSAAEFEEKMVSLALAWAISDKTQLDPEKLNFEVMEKVVNQYIPDKAFFVLHYFKAQYSLDNEEIETAISETNILLANTPAKVNFDQACNAMMNLGPAFAKIGKLEPLLKKLEAIKIPPADIKKAYMKDYVKAIIYIKTEEFDKFRALANKMITRNDVPADVKEDLRAAISRLDE